MDICGAFMNICGAFMNICGAFMARIRTMTMTTVNAWQKTLNYGRDLW